MLPTRLSPRLRIIFPRIFSRPASFKPKASPPRLPDAEQLEFERLQRSAGVSSAFQPSTTSNTTSSTSKSNTSDTNSTSSPSASANTEKAKDKDTEADELHPNVFRGAKPEFEGDTNPKTGEVGGPKNEPLRWGGAGDWSYNGRVTDF